MMMKSEAKFKKGHYIGLGIAIGLPVGIPVGLALGNIALGPLIGVSVGLTIGYVLEQKYNGTVIEFTEEEKAKQKRVSLLLMAIGLFMLVAFTTIYFFKLK